MTPQRITIDDFQVTDEGSRTAQTYSFDLKCWRQNSGDEWEVERVTYVSVEIQTEPRGVPTGFWVGATLRESNWTLALWKWLRESDTLNAALQSACEAAWAEANETVGV